MTNIKVDAQDRQFVCKINGIGYYVNTIDMEESEYYNVRYNKKTNLYITEYKASFQYNGYLTSTTNMLRQQTSDTMFQMSELVIKEGKVKLEDITTDFVQKNLYQDLPPVDLMIRTSGEYRLSNFMMYQNSYAEFYFPDVYFPDFNKDEFEKAILEFNRRNRRFGG